MYQALLRNKWLLLVCAVLLLAFAQFFPDGSGEPLSGAEAATSQDEPISTAEEEAEAVNAPSEQDYENVEFVSDEELIDSAAGFDPTPAEENFDDGGGGDFEEEPLIFDEG